MKLNGQYFTIFYYYAGYYIGVTKVYNSTIWATDEESARKEFSDNYPNAHIKYIQS